MDVVLLPAPSSLLGLRIAAAIVWTRNGNRPRMGLFSEIAVYFKDSVLGLVPNYGHDMKRSQYACHFILFLFLF